MNGTLMILDVLRKKFVALTPEEWVRQHFIHFLIGHKGYPSTYMANEVALTQNGMTRRCDSVLYHKDLQPWMIIEYKAAHVPITQKVFDQICRYNMVLNVEYLIVSNGKVSYCCRLHKETGRYEFLRDIPDFNML